MTKLDLDPSFDYRDDPEVVRLHNENLVIAVLGSLPIIGHGTLLIVILYEASCRWWRCALLITVRIKRWIRRIKKEPLFRKAPT